MDQTKLDGDIANEVSSANAANQSLPSVGANEIRSLSDIEIVLATGGGDPAVCW